MVTLEPAGKITAPAPTEAGLRCENLSKTYGESTVLSGVSLSLAPGEVLALLGANGAGKSTFVKILSGVVAPDPGGVIHLGSTRSGRGLAAHQARTLGIRVVHQDAPVFQTLPLVDSIAIRWRYQARLLAPIRWRGVQRKVQRLLDTWDVRVDPNTPAGLLTPGERALVSLGLLFDDDAEPPKVLILDELTASLPRQDIDRVMEPVMRFAKQGTAVIMVTHRLEEVIDYADKVLILRDGRMVDSAPKAERSIGDLARLISGPSAVDDGGTGLAPTTDDLAQKTASEPILVAEGLETESLVAFDLSLRPGEIVGVTGHSGSGVEDVASALAGGRRRGGRLAINGEPLPSGRPRAAVRAGVGYVPGDRLKQGAVAGMSIEDNLLMPRFAAFWHRRARAQGELQELLELLDVNTRDPRLPLGALSGGNQQKVVFAKWVGIRPKVLIAEAPTIGVDIGTRARIYDLIRRQAAAGVAVCVVSEDVMDIAAVCERVLVLDAGRVRREVVPQNMQWESLAAELFRHESSEAEVEE